EMLRVLPTDRGELGERSWFHFALRCARDAWRGKDRQGRRGEHIEPPRQEPEWNGDGWTNPVEEALAADSPSNELDPDVYTLLAEVIAGITDPLIRKVGEDLWLSGDPSPVTGKQKSAGGKPALVTQLGESRDKLVRAEGVVLARILAELERRGIARERLDPYRKKPRWP
ncbi:MAG TPA: hypothetical protein VK399_14530, partial [Longimicrobiaceae bacterium]|nr:hypothetical protein [Longimicrobiaceae bacterium]